MEQDDTTTTEEENPMGAPRKCKMQSVTALKKALTEAKIKEKQRQYDKATKWRCATEAALGHVDLETEMEKAEYVETTIAVTEGTATVVTMAAASSSTHVVTAEVYAKPYTKTTESRGVRSMARSKKKEAKEREATIQKQKDEEECIAKEKEAEEQRKVVEQALLEEEEKAQVEVLRKLREKEEKKKPKDTSEKESKKQEKEAKK